MVRQIVLVTMAIMNLKIWREKKFQGNYKFPLTFLSCCKKVFEFNNICHLVQSKELFPLIFVSCCRNPMGRTGMRGRGLLGKWGPNHAADPIVSR